jgi:hypothetical protein
VEISDGAFPRTAGPSTATKGDFRVRAWVLLLLDAVSRTGLSPISKLRYHRLAFLTNCLSSIYRVRAADERIVKHPRGPYYPTLQWHLDRLAGEGLASISRIRHFADSNGPWMDAYYAITRTGVGVVERLCLLESLSLLARFLLEIAKAYASQQDHVLDNVLLEDLTYDDLRRGHGAVIDFSRLQDNLSLQGAESFSALVREPRSMTTEDRIHLYLEYLDRKHSRRRTAGL